MGTVRDVMTAEPIVLQRDQSIADAARAMRDNAVGSVLVVDGDKLCGLVTDRDIVVRALAESAPPGSPVGAVCSPDLVAVDAGDDTAEALRGDAGQRRPAAAGHGQRPYRRYGVDRGPGRRAGR